MGLSGGGGGGSQSDPIAEMQAQAELERQREERQRAQAEQDRIRDEQIRAQKLAAFNTNVGSTRDNTYSSVLDEIMGRNITGLNVDSISDRLGRTLDRTVQNIPELDPNIGSYFSDDFATQVLGQERDHLRNDFTTQIDNITPFGFAKNLVNDTDDDAILGSILGDRYTDASEQVLRARNRGNLNEAGFATATNLLNDARTTGNARFQELGSAVLSGDRDRLRDESSQFRTQAGSFELGQQFDPTGLRSSIDNLRAEQTGTLEGRIRDAVSGENPFDTPGILNSAGIKQGVFNPAGSGAGGGVEGSLLSAVTDRKAAANKDRGVGSQGVF